MHTKKTFEQKKLLQVGLQLVDLNSHLQCEQLLCYHLQNHYNESITGHKELKKPDDVKICNLKKKNRDHKKVPKQDEDVGNLQILLHLRSLF